MSKTKEDTPLIKQFFSIKAKYPDTVLLYRVGDFYETYGSDAVLASKVLGIVLTRRANGDKGYIEMAGFPYHAIESYMPKLLRAGYKTAVCDQLEDPALVNKKLVDRGVTEIVTPGVVFGEQMLDSSENNFLAGLTFDGESCGVAFLDVSTGTFQVAQGTTDYVGTLLGSFQPKELVVQRDCVRSVKERFGEVYVTSLDEWAFVPESAVEKLKKQMGTASLKGFALDGYELAVCSAGALLVYLEQTRHSGLKNICSISRIESGSFVWMDRFTFRNLEVFCSASGEDDVSLVKVMDRCACPMGSRLLRRYLKMPELDLAEINGRYDVVEHFRNDAEALDGVRQLLADLFDVERICSRAATGKISPREALQLARSLDRAVPIAEICVGSGVKALDELMVGLRDCSSLTKEIGRKISPEAASAIGKGDVIAKGVDRELDELRSISAGGRDYLMRMQQREIERTGITSLKIGYNNVFGYYLEVRNTFKDMVPPEWTRKQTLVNAERYITQELKEYESRILGAEDRIYVIESRIFSELVSRIQDNIPDIQVNCGILAKLDVLTGFARQAIDRGYCRPSLDDGFALDIKGGRHPVIETVMPAGEEYVPNDLYLDNATRQIIILTGPNMAGKSALLRQTALIVLMAQTGSFVPADSAHIGVVDKIFTRVGATDNIARGESTFMVEMLETSMIMHNLSERSLVLLDEIGRGTSTYDGMSIARALVEYIHEHGHGAKTLFATHYHELNDLEKNYPRVHNCHIAVREEGKEVIFLRKMEEGGVAHSFGIHVARLAGMPREIIESAEKTLRHLENGGNKTVSDEGIQLSIFQLDDPTLYSVRDTLKGADLNNMTPLQAFDLLRKMKKELGI
ncbi:MAG: DNA mismatch repair protein MutS [Bacteroidales bacterium]|nr:DNA mismatch repair protein MutS [Bacteroidales bacterium]